MRCTPIVTLVLLFSFAACGSGGGGTSGTPDDGGTVDDASPDLEPDLEPDLQPDPEPDSGPAIDAIPDTAPEATEELPPAVPLAGFGVITGDCGVLDDDEWLSADPFLFRNEVDFGTTAFEASLLSPAGQEVEKDGNLGGSSIHSESIAVDLLYRCELANLLKTEREIVYVDKNGKKTDALVTIDGRKVGVSVVRAFHYPPTDPCTAADADKLMIKKLGDIPLSAANAADEDAWERSVLHVIAYNDQCADAFAAAWESLDFSVRASTIVVITTTEGKDDFIYTNN